MMKIYCVTESIPWEGDNVWIFAADNEEDIKQYLKDHYNPNPWNLSFTLISNISDYKAFEEILSI